MRYLMVSFLTLLHVLFAAKVQLHDGRGLETETVYFDGSYLITDQDTIPRSDVKEIIFETVGGQQVGSVAADEDVQALLEQAAQAQRSYPDAKGILLIDDGKDYLHTDGTRNHTYHMAYLILSDARKSIATFRHYYNEGDNEVKINFARVIKPSGRVIDLDPANIKIETPPNEDIVFFGKNKWVTFTLPDVQIGDIVEYSYENIRFNPWNKEFFEAGFFFRGDDPFIYSRLSVDIPEEEFIQWKAYYMPAKWREPEITVEDGRKILTWTIENSAPYVPEPNSPPEGDFLAHVELTNQKDWEAIHDWYAGFQNERLVITPGIQTLTDSLTVGKETPEEKIPPIYTWVQQNIRYISIKGSASSGVSGHPAQFTLEQGYGDCTDKSNLFATMLRAAGIDADPVYVGTNDEISMLDPEIPNYYGNHCITEVFLPDTSFYLDATGSSDGGFSRYPSFSAGDHGVYAVNSQKRKVEIVPVPDPEQEKRLYTLDMEIDEQGNLLVSYQSFYRGDYETYLRYFWNYVSREEDRRIRFEQMIKSESPDAELVSYELVNLEDLNQQLSLKISYRIKDFVTFAGPIALFNLPEVGNRLVFDEVALEKRILPLAYATSEAIEHQVTLKLPKDWKVDYISDPLNLSVPDIVSYEAEFITDESNTIIFQDEFRRSARIIEPQDYEEYREVLNTITNYHKKPIVVLVEGGGQ